LYGSIRRCLVSVFEWHNETLNIWTHLLGCLWFLWLAGYSWVSFEGKGLDAAVVVIYCLGAASTLLLSTVFHTFNAHSHDVCMACHALDWATVAVLIGAADLLVAWAEVRGWSYVILTPYSSEVHSVCVGLPRSGMHAS
jgi:adiponectin receptor